MSGYRDDDAAALRREVERLEEALAERTAQRDAALAEVARWSKRDRIANVLVVAGKVLVAACLIAGAAGAVVAAVRGCASEPPPLAAGVITDRYDDPAYTTPGYWSSFCTGAAPRRTCMPIYHPPIEHPEVWSIRIAHGGRDRVITMSEAAWTATHVGGVWCDGPEAECDLNNVERRR